MQKDRGTPKSRENVQQTEKVRNKQRKYATNRESTQRTEKVRKLKRTAQQLVIAARITALSLITQYIFSRSSPGNYVKQL